MFYILHQGLSQKRQKTALINDSEDTLYWEESQQS